MRELSTFKIGGPARYYTEIATIQQAQQVLSFCHEKGFRYVVIGKGSNSLFDDRGFDGLVIGNRIMFMEQQGERFYVGGGYSFSRLGTQTARMGFGGLEFAAGIPGSVGGAVYMNAGANGSETANVLVSVDFVNSLGQLETYPSDRLNFGYRTSWFQQAKGIIVAALFVLVSDSAARQRQIRIVDNRRSTQPYLEPSAGCVFRNPSGTERSAGGLIDRAGLKGMAVGDAQVSEQHANFIVNRGEATAQQVLELMSLVRKRVQEVSGVNLESEVRFIPFEER